MPTAHSAALPPTIASDAAILAALAAGQTQTEIARTLRVSPKRIVRLRRQQATTTDQVSTAPAIADEPDAAIALIEDLISVVSEGRPILVEAVIADPEPEAPRIAQGRIHAASPRLIYGRTRKAYFFTSAQDFTAVHEDIFASVLNLCDDQDAELFVGGYAYAVDAVGNADRGRVGLKGESVFASEVTPYLSNESIEIAPGLIWSGEIDRLPTMVDPLSGLDNYHRGASGIIPHAKVRMKSLPGMKGVGPRQLFSTGTITRRNYVQRGAGQRAEFHHTYGGLLVEVEADGTWFARQVIGGEDGTLQDLDRVYTPEGVRYGVAVEAFQAGDIHIEQAPADIIASIWGRGGLVDCLRPKTQLVHDLFDCTARNHHNIRDPWFRAKQHHSRKRGADNVETGVIMAAEFLATANRPWCDTIVVESNHDRALARWLKEADYRQDPENAKYFHYLNYRAFQAIERGDEGFMILEEAIREKSLGGRLPERVRFLRTDESYQVKGIECGLHGDLGPNGARGTPNAFRSLGCRANTGHTHSCGIVEGVYTAGALSMDMGYNCGPSSWSVSHIVTYSNGKRAVLTQRGTRWRAGGVDAETHHRLSQADLDDIILRA